MVLKWLAVAVLVVSYVVFKAQFKLPAANKQQGFYAPGWQKVVDLYRHYINDGLLDGGAFAVYYKGKLVVEVSGGYADEQSRWEWTNDTLSQFFSTTKAVSSVVMAMLVERGLLQYDMPVSKYWPEFAQNGKKDITVEQLLSHQAGLPALDEQYSYLDILHNNSKMSSILAAQKPHWTPGEKHGYHALTLGLYEDQIVRRVDKKKRSLSQFFGQEVAKPFGIDFFIGLPKNQNYRCARNTDKTLASFISDLPKIIAEMPFYFALFNPSHVMHKSVNIKEEMSILDGYYNQPAFREVPNGAASGFGTAIAVAKFFGILANGGTHNGKKLLSEKLIAKLQEVLVKGFDVSLNKMGGSFGRGHSIFKSPKGSVQFGAPGAGGQVGKADSQYHVGIAYLTNHMTPYGTGDGPLFLALEKVVYDTIEQLETRK